MTGVLLLVLAVLIGWARVAAHIHHPIDILGSFVIAGLSVMLVQWSALVATKWRDGDRPHNVT